MYLKGAYQKNGERVFTRLEVIGQGDSFELKEDRFRLDLRK